MTTPAPPVGRLSNNDPVVRDLEKRINRDIDRILFKAGAFDGVSANDWRMLGQDARELNRRRARFHRIEPAPSRFVPENEYITRIKGRIESQLIRIAVKGDLNALSENEWRLMALDIMMIRKEGFRSIHRAERKKDKLVELMFDIMGGTVLEIMEVKLLGKVLAWIATAMSAREFLKEEGDD